MMSPAIRVSIAAVALSVSVMLAAVAIVMGFKNEIRQKVVGFNAHISLFSDTGDPESDNIITLTPSLRSVLGEFPFISEYSLGASIPGVLKTPGDFKGIYLRSLGGLNLTDFISRNTETGEIPDFSNDENRNKIVISRLAATQLGLSVGDKVDAYFFSDQIRTRRFEIAAIFNSHFDSYDTVVAYGSLSLIQSLAGLSENQGTNIQIYTDNFDNVSGYSAQMTQELARCVADGTLFRFYRIENAISQGAGYFNWLSLLDMNVVVILTLMTLVAVATLISGMLILILDKRRVIGVVRALGAPVSTVRTIFIWLAMKVALIGMSIGNVLMLSFLLCQRRFHFLPLDPEAYYIDFVPVSVDWRSVVGLNIATVVIMAACLILPSGLAARISPAEAMRDE